MIKCHLILYIFKSQSYTTHIHWIFSHKDIIENKKADIATQKNAEQKIKICSENFIFISYTKCLIKTEALVSWKTYWNLIKKEHIYIKMKIESYWNQNKYFKNINRL